MESQEACRKQAALLGQAGAITGLQQALRKQGSEWPKQGTGTSSAMGQDTELWRRGEQREKLGGR